MSRLKGKWSGNIALEFDIDKKECVPIKEANRLLCDVLSSSIQERLKEEYDAMVKITDVKVEKFTEVEEDKEKEVKEN